MSIGTLLKRFQNDERGNMAIELCLVVPILTWVLLSTFVYFDVFRTEANAKRASLTIADMFSRELSSIDANYMLSAKRLLGALTFAESDPDIRVTVYQYDASINAYLVVWSRHVGMDGELQNADLTLLQGEGRLPLLDDGFQSILVETQTDYSAPFSIGLGPFTGGVEFDDLTFETATVFRPRFTPKLCWAQSGSPDICDPA